MYMLMHPEGIQIHHERQPALQYLLSYMHNMKLITYPKIDNKPLLGYYVLTKKGIAYATRVLAGASEESSETP